MSKLEVRNIVLKLFCVCGFNVFSFNCFRFLCDDNLLWKEKCKKAAIVIEPTTDKPKRGRAGNMPPISSQWKVSLLLN